MPPSSDSPEVAEFPAKDIRSTLQTFTFTFDKTSAQRSIPLQHEIDTTDTPRKRPSTLAEDLMRVKTNLERVMAMDMVEPSPRTIVPYTIIPRQEEIVQSTETEDTTPSSAGSRRSRASALDDLPVLKTKMNAPDIIIESVEADIEAAEPQKSAEVDSIVPSADPSRDITPHIVRSKFEALGMFSRNVTPAAPGSNLPPGQSEAGVLKESLGDEKAQTEPDEEVRQKLQAVGAIAPTASAESVTSNEEVAQGDIRMEDTHNEFLQSKLEAMGVLPRPPSPALSSSSSSRRRFSTSSMSIDDEEGEVSRTEVYDEFLQSKLEAMGLLTSRYSQSANPSTTPQDNTHRKHSSQAESNFTSPPDIIVDSIENKSQGDGAPPLSRAASRAAVSGMAAGENMDDNEYLDISSRRSSMNISAEETPSLTRESSYSASGDELVEIRKKSTVEIHHAQLIQPLSQVDNYPRPLPISKERRVVKDYLEIINDEHNQEHAGHSFIEFDMDEFMIYLPGTARHHPYEMTGLQNLFQDGHKEYLIDGIISMDGEEERYIEGVMFDILSIGTYGKDNQEVNGVWIQTKLNKDSDIYYRLRKPHKYYERFHTGFMWLANLAKNFVDYAMDCEEAEKKVSIHNFRRDFYDWLIENHGNETPLQKWYAEYGNPDFRTVIASNIDWLAKEAIGSWKLEFLDVFSEVKYVDKLPFHRAKEKMTVVTPFVYECFKEMNFGRFLKKVDPNADTDFRRKSIGEALHLSTDQDVIELDSEDDNDYEKTTARLAKRSLEDFKSRPFDQSTIAVGDVLAVVKDSGDVSKWKSEKTKWSEVDECWFIYVQAIEKRHGQRALRILWMYKPADTSCALMKYPYQDELFLSAHCECDQPEWITEDQVVCRVSVAWNGNHGCKEDFFVRQRFHQLEISFTTLKESDKMCGHMRFEITPAEQVQRLYTIGSTVLYQPKILEDDQRQRLEPGVIHSFNEGEGLTLHKLLRRSESDPTSNAKANELVHTDIQVYLRPDQIHHECQIRFYSSKDVAEKTVPPPYSLDGACDFFYICTRQIEDLLHGGPPRYKEIDSANPPPSLIQGFDPRAPQPKNPMRGLDLFCGGGNMGRGLEDGGAVRFTHACDYQDNAIASYYANTEDTEHTKFFAGSVNDLLKHAMDGNPSNISGVPLPGDIEFISAGSPCQGFSNMNPLQMNDEALRNQSLVADVASMVEFYRPKYAILENVVAMAKKGKTDRREDCLSQLICCLVGMGYQLQVNMLDAWAFGCPQRRQRLFVVVAAPDLAMPKPPHQSHSHPSSMTNASLGLMANGLPFGQRIWTDTAFKWRSAEEATADLPDIGDGQTYYCTPFPDHRTSFNMKQLLRDQLAAIPFFPPGLNARTAWPKMSGHERSLFAVKSPATGVLTEKTAKQMENSFERVKGGQLFPTITTKCAPSEKRNGRVGHWSRQRVISIMEAKRAQGFLDTDVLVGTRSGQYKIIGNSVARPVAIGQGMALRKAWLLNEDDNPSLDAALVPITVRDDFAQLDLPAAPSSKGSELAYERRMKGVESSNSEMGEDSSVSSAPPKRRESQFEVAILARKSIVEFSSSPVQQTAGYVRSLTSSLSDLPFTPAWPGAHAHAPSKAKANAPSKNDAVQMREADAGEERRQGFQELPRIRPGMAEVKRSAKKRRRMMGGATPGSSRGASESPAPVANMSRADTSIVQASQKLAHLGRRRSQTGTPVPTVSRLGTPAPRPSSRLSQKPIEQGFKGTNDRSIAQAAAQFAGIGRRRSQTSSQQVSRAATPHVEHDEDEEGPRPAKRRKLPTKPIVPGSAERPISLDDSGDEAVPIPMRMATNRARTYTPAARVPDAEAPISVARAQTPQPRSSGWTAVNTPPSANTIMAQLPLVGRANYTDRASPSPAPSRKSRAGAPRVGTPRPRAKKGKKPKEPFVIDLTADDDMPSNSARVSREITPYQPVDNSAWMGMLFTKSVNGGLGGKDVDALLGMDLVEAESAFGDVEVVRQVEGGEAVQEEGRPEVVYGY